MELIYATFEGGKLIEDSYITDCKVDCELGNGTNNDTEITIYNTTNLLEVGNYILNDDIGGVIDGYKIDTSDNSVVYHVLTWRGILDKKIIPMDTGQDYRQVDKSLLADCINRNCDGVLKAKTEEIVCPNTLEVRYQSYLDVFNMIDNEVEDGAILNFYYDCDDGCIYVSNNQTNSIDEPIEISNDTNISLVVKEQYDYNHIIALGSGQLGNRDVLELYYNDDGTITIHPKNYDKSLKTYVYDYSNVESYDELKKAAIKKLGEIAVIKETHVDILSGDYRINEVIHVREYTTHFDEQIKISQKIYTGAIERGISKIKIDYKVGD